MTNVGVESILEKNALSEKDVINCINEVSRFDSIALASYRNVNCNWKEMNLFSVKRIIELFNKSLVNIKTGKILKFHEESLFSFKETDTVRFSLMTKYMKSIKSALNVKTFVVGKRTKGESYICFNGSSLEVITFSRYGYPDSFDFLEKVEVNLSKVDKETQKLIFIMYVRDKSGPKQVFSSANLEIKSDYDFYNIELVKEANSSFGALGFEVKRQKDRWDVFAIGDAMTLSLKDFTDYY